MDPTEPTPDPLAEEQAFDHLFDSVLLPIRQRLVDFDDPKQQWRRVAAELLGTFFLVLVAAGADMVGQQYPGSISRSAAVIAPGLMVMAMIMFMGKVSGAHFNPCVTLAFSLRRDFPWRRVPSYLVAQVMGAIAAVGFLCLVIPVPASAGGTYPGSHTTALAAVLIEAVLTLGLISVILGTASGAQNVGVLGALAVGGYIALAGLWASPLTGASMNPVRSFGPDLVGRTLGTAWIYLLGPLLGALLAVVSSYVLRGRGGGVSGSLAAEGTLFPEIAEPEKP
jgi:aquaporin Z